MNKAILILDEIPKNCDNCPILDYCYTDKLDLSIRQPFCPLKEIPDCVLDVVNGIKNDYVNTKEVCFMKKGKYQLEKKCSFWKSLYLAKIVDIETVLLIIIPIILAVIAIPITIYVSLSYQMDALETIFAASIIISGIVLAYYISVLIIALIILLFSALKDIKYMATSCIKFIKALLAQRYLPISEQDLTNNNIRTTEEYWDMMEYVLRLGDKETIIYEKNKEQCQLVYEEYFNTNDFNAKLLQLYEKFLNEQKEGSTTHPLKGVGL